MAVLSFLLFALLALFAHPSLQQALPDPIAADTKSSVFVYNNTDAGVQIVFAVNVVKSTGDLYFHLSSPAGNSWIGVGVGTQMKGATMFIAYPSSNGTGVTISGRVGRGHTEPSYNSGIVIEQLWNTSLPDANTIVSSGDSLSIVADAVCRNCTTFLSTDLSLSSAQQPFIFAVGPPSFHGPLLASDSPEAGLQRHVFYGQFTMNMTQAVSDNSGGVPIGPYSTNGASQAIGTHVDSDPAPHIHGLLMCVVFVLIFPAGSLVLRVMNKVKAHAAIQIVALVLFCGAFVGGCVVSTQYNRTRNFNQGHQIIGILLLIALFAQLALGVLNHRVYKKTQRSTMMGKVHLYFGPVIILFGLINGGLGFKLASLSIVAIPYAIVVVVVAIGYAAIRFGSAICRGRVKASAQDDAFRQPQFGHPPTGVPQNGYGEPAGGYEAPPPPYGQRIPLQTYESSQSLPHVDLNPVQPRNMV